MREDRSILIISDLHLGYRAKDISIKDYKDETEHMDKYFQRFINYYIESDKEKEWELIINGDFIDFIQINYRLESEFSKDYKLSLDEIKYGMNNKEVHIIWKLKKIAKIHHNLFKDIANFINQGNYFTLLKGNHDVEFYWPEVKKEFKNILLGFIDFKTDKEREEFLSRIKIKDWIYYEKDFFYIEHGNQYDDYTSFNHFVTPLNVINHKKIEMPYSHISMRYWINLTKDFETHNLSNWGFSDFIAWVKREGPKGMLMHVFYYFRALIMVLNNVKFAKKFDPYVYLKERFYIKKIAKVHEVDPKALIKINMMKRTPVGDSVYQVLSSFYIEGILIVLSFFSFLAYSFYVQNFIRIFFAFIFFIFISIMFYYIFSIDREIEPENKLLEASKDISKLLKAKYYIFGHTHHPYMEKIAKNKKYINSGSWLLRSPQNIPDKFSYNLSHIVIINKEASLKLWKPNYDKPIEFNEYLKVVKEKK